jgi:hypothetical protein
MLGSLLGSLGGVFSRNPQREFEVMYQNDAFPKRFPSEQAAREDFRRSYGRDPEPAPQSGLRPMAVWK